ncbi:F0F1 ATP synthase subunit alpha [Candidatus Gottesmanbacteria bacterium RIFOXYB1_FULL_47_11]|uniref:ATP synthase subunit alpha n=1 Tax=Candidatus Gottesmanbacteria bacterium RIFOXYB1_FULL_47_11 TaxID=1798401 RepID=A0A1F6BF62_9BACT|nr:MAG: F0F1 ATP synthase subunit alpha [Candidatus Gottesmanbacteria bacterium RIFOXYB1_FULL_47_11]
MKNDFTQDIAKELLKKIEQYTPAVSARQVGHVLSVSDGVARVSGLPHVASMERVIFANGVSGLAFNLEEDVVGVIVLGDYLTIREGDEVRASAELLSIPVGDALLGRVVNPIGDPMDGGTPVKHKIKYPLEKIAPSVTHRRSVKTPLQTGIKGIDAMIPIGRGQRELIVGDRNTGKTSIAVDTIINQKKENVVCIYVAIGQKTSRIAQVIRDLTRAGAMAHTVVVFTSASDPAAFQYLAPYAGCAIGEYFMDQGRDALIIYDDLSKHAWAYRQISLILRRPSGREAYPGDVFYLHSRLLERACRLDEKHGGGSLTALPIVETQANDISGYIPTNIISITDGQLFLESDLFNAGQRPAINVGFSVSRVGGEAQSKAMKKVSGTLKLDLAQYRSLAAFAQFSSDVDAATKKQIDRGARMMELLKQGQFVPMAVEDQIMSIWAGTAGYLDDVPVNRISQFEKEYLAFMHARNKKTVAMLTKEKALTADIEKQLKESVAEFKKGFK